MAPVIAKLAEQKDLHSFVCVTGQHQELLHQTLSVFGITPHYDLKIMEHAQTLSHITSAVLEGVGRVLDEISPHCILVHGDTTTTMAASLAAFYNKVPVAHVEAGLRTHNMLSPWPEEMNRCITDRIATLHFAPTATARRNLLAEAISPENIMVTGNTAIDALFWAKELALKSPETQRKIENDFPFIDCAKNLILVTGHRRENFDGGLENVYKALQCLANRDDVQIIFPVHPNPNVRSSLDKIMQDAANLHLVEPVDYLSFVWLMNSAKIIITDSGGIQEEAPSLGKPVLVTRDATERPEAVDVGTVRVIGTDTNNIIRAASTLLDDPDAYNVMASAANPYGDGFASKRILEAILSGKFIAGCNASSHG
jgi:UDP-N-acetylglucosamine 2-epimerase (non-hydrolysing)